MEESLILRDYCESSPTGMVRDAYCSRDIAGLVLLIPFIRADADAHRQDQSDGYLHFEDRGHTCGYAIFDNGRELKVDYVTGCGHS